MQHYRNPVFGHSSPSAPPSGHLRPGPSAVQDLDKLLQLRPHWSGAIRLVEHVFPSHLSIFRMFPNSFSFPFRRTHLPSSPPFSPAPYSFHLRPRHSDPPLPTPLPACTHLAVSLHHVSSHLYSSPHFPWNNFIRSQSHYITHASFRLYSRDSGPAIVASIWIDNSVQDSRLLYIVLAVYSYPIVIWCVPNLLAFPQPLVYGHGVFHNSYIRGLKDHSSGSRLQPLRGDSERGKLLGGGK